MSGACRSPGFGLTLVAETLNGSFLSAEMSSTPQGQGDPSLPEDLGRNCAMLLLEEVYRVSTADEAYRTSRARWWRPFKQRCRFQLFRCFFFGPEGKLS